jgi:putative acetyltransferase
LRRKSPTPDERPKEVILSRFEIRPERPPDYSRVDQIHRAAFGQDGEARLVESLRKRASPHLSLVAEIGDELVGHVMFSPVSIEGVGDPPPIAGLAPLAVSPEAQGQGAGSALVRAGLSDCDSIGWQAVFLLGDPAYYSRFGFDLAATRGLRYESEAFDAAFQFIELVPGALSGCRGWVRYHEAFSELA